MSNESVLLDCIVKADPPSTIKGWVNNSFVTLAASATDLIAVILLLVTVTVGVPADVTSNDLIIIVSFIKGLPAPKGTKALPVVSLSMPLNLYWFTTAIILKRNS
jgi:hypothetical protein